MLGDPDENGLLGPRISPDGRRVAVYRTEHGNTDIWLLDSARRNRFTFGAGLNRFPLWSPDGSRIVFDSNRNGVRNLYIKLAGGASDEELLLESLQDKTPTDWSRKALYVLFHSIDPSSNRDLWVMPLQGDRKPRVFLKTNFDERWAQLSPDDRWVAYMSNESGRDEIYVRPFVEDRAGKVGGDKLLVSTAGGSFPLWRKDGKELYYLSPDGKLLATPIHAQGTSLEAGAPGALFQPRIVGGGVDYGQGRNYDVSRDGHFLINIVLDAAAPPITLLQNWRAPVK
jgi:Tol biopolymer transport system component